MRAAAYRDMRAIDFYRQSAPHGSHLLLLELMVFRAKISPTHFSAESLYSPVECFLDGIAPDNHLEASLNSQDPQTMETQLERRLPGLCRHALYIGLVMACEPQTSIKWCKGSNMILCCSGCIQCVACLIFNVQNLRGTRDTC